MGITTITIHVYLRHWHYVFEKDTFMSKPCIIPEAFRGKVHICAKDFLKEKNVLVELCWEFIMIFPSLTVSQQYAYLTYLAIMEFGLHIYCFSSHSGHSKHFRVKVSRSPIPTQSQASGGWGGCQKPIGIRRNKFDSMKINIWPIVQYK